MNPIHHQWQAVPLLCMWELLLLRPILKTHVMFRAMRYIYIVCDYYSIKMTLLMIANTIIQQFPADVSS